MRDTVCMKMILASRSPRRKKILTEMGYEFESIVADVDENIIQDESPEEHVMRLSAAKAEKVAIDYPDDLVIGADTAVVLDGVIMGKPESEDDAFEMLRKLSGKTHTVFTGITVMISNEDIKKTDHDRTNVIFNRLKDDEIREYVESGEPLDKAGSYGIQGMGSFLVKKYDGELDTVIGLPSKKLEKMREEVLTCLNR